jgi:hypothetical protein
LVGDTDLGQIHFARPETDWQVGGKRAGSNLRGFSMSTFPMEYEAWPLTVPPSYEQCVEAPGGTRANYVISPLAMAALLASEEDGGEL